MAGSARYAATPLHPFPGFSVWVRLKVRVGGVDTLP